MAKQLWASRETMRITLWEEEPAQNWYGDWVGGQRWADAPDFITEALYEHVAPGECKRVTLTVAGGQP